MDAPLTPLLIDAKREYVGQLTDILAPYVLGRMRAMWDATATARRDRVQVFQRMLRDIPAWNAQTVASHTNEVSNRYPYLGDLIAAVFVSYTKILSSIKLSATAAPVRLKLPENDAVVHQVYVHTAKEIYAVPSLITSPDAAARVAIVRAAIETAVRAMLPIGEILRAYLGGAVDTDHTMNAVPDVFGGGVPDEVGAFDGTGGGMGGEGMGGEGMGMGMGMGTGMGDAMGGQQMMGGGGMGMGGMGMGQQMGQQMVQQPQMVQQQPMGNMIGQQQMGVAGYQPPQDAFAQPPQQFPQQFIAQPQQDAFIAQPQQDVRRIQMGGGGGAQQPEDLFSDAEDGF